MSKHLDRLLRETGDGDLLEVLAERLAPTDLQSLMLEVYRRRAEGTTPAKVLERYKSGRFVRPSVLDPVRLLELDQIAFSLAEGFERVELSPVCPLGTSSAVAGVSQNVVVSTARNSEVVADSTNVLALECALRRSSQDVVRLCASHRLTRAQLFDQPNSWAHFRLFALCTAGRDVGGYGFEVAALLSHLDFYLRLLATLGIGSARVLLTDFSGSREAVLQAGILDVLAARYPAVSFGFYPERESGRGYYDRVCFQVHAGDQFLVDGGLTDWTQKLLGSRKERLMTSGIGSERLCLLSVAG